MKRWRLCRRYKRFIFLFIWEISVENKDKNEIKYAVIYSMIMDLYEQGSIDKATAEKINSKCAEQLECRKMAVR